MGKSSQKQIVTEYRLSVHFGICTAVDELLEIKVNDKEIWSGSLSEPSDVYIDRLDVFGGVKKEGGIQGMLSFLPGKPDQVMPEFLANRLGFTSDICPAFRGVASFWLHGGDNREGCVWSYNNPIVAQTVSAKVRRRSVGLDPDLAMIGPDSNPAHMIYECLTNADWGMGAAPTSIDTASFTACAQTFFDESFGLSMIWRDQMKIEDFVSEILDHVMAMLFVNPRTGLLTLKALRDDYDFNELRVLTPDNADLTSFQRKMWGEVVNEIVVSWTNPENEQEETVTAQDLANIGIQGAPVSDGRNYYGVRNAELAARLAARDIRMAAAPLATVEAMLDRSAWDIYPGELIRLTWPEYDLEDIVMRVGKVDYGRPSDPMIKVSLLEDIFSLLKPNPLPTPGTGWENPSETPRPIDYAQVITLPAFFVTNSDYVSADFNLNYPEVLGAVLAAQDSADTASFELLTEQASAAGSVSYSSAGTKTIVGRMVLEEPLAYEPVTLLPAASITDSLRAPRVGGFVFIGNIVDDGGGSGAGGDGLGLSGIDGDLLLSGYPGDPALELRSDVVAPAGEGLTEIALVESFDGENYVLARGVLDTVPRAHAAGTPLWFVNPGARFADEIVVRSAGETVEYKVQTRTSKDLLPESEATLETGVMTGRPHLPYRPANVQVNGVAFGEVDSPVGDLTITWATRNRLLEDTQVMRWTDGPVAPEYQQETLVSIIGPDGTLVYQQTGLWTENELVLPVSYFARYEFIFVVVQSRRNGLWSLQGQAVKVTGLPNNPAADPPPTAPPPGPPPGFGPAPADYQWTATPGTFVSNGTTLPVITVAGSSSDQVSAEGVLIEILPSGDTTWNTIALLPTGAVSYPINQVEGGRSYSVGISYKLNGIYGERLVIGPVSTAIVTTPGGGGGSVAPVSSDWMSDMGRGVARHLVAETGELVVGSAGARLSVSMAGFVGLDVATQAAGSWQLYTVVAGAETLIDSGRCDYDNSYIVGDPVGDFMKVNAKIYDLGPGSTVLRLYISGGGPAGTDTGEIYGSILGVLYAN